MRTRLLAGVLATAVLSAGLTAAGIALPAAACACGAPTPPAGTVVSVGEEHALVSYDGTTERIDLVLDMLADGADTGLVLPTPTPATVSLGDAKIFDALDTQTAPEVEVVEDWWGGMSDGASAGAPPEVLSEVDLGPVQAVTLAASDAAGLQAWLTANGYGIDPAVQSLFADYIARGWSFAALKLTGEEPLDGTLDPVRFEFATSEVVYPLLLSQAAQTPQTVRLYLFGDDTMQAAFPDGTVAGDVTWAGPVTQAVLKQFGAYLTVVEAYFPDPAGQITGDLTITSTGARADYTPVVTRTKYVQIGGVPVGLALAVVGTIFGLMVLLVVLGGIVHRRGERRRRVRY
ncbi:DUF2330 domain-containing protein [Protaetiibacter intestinalis]|uniref:DUF2330 domain-containing protein n=1 Tax=Protaetiibacter intestinalis TaxID=2419774 RepID=A0A387BAW0_9MICO|nr:DUF2330 domain-containing protein [Protaetiibacter intestinalis]AYF98848.1 DUF2330 domain-containing protein [Protaetiibacter intestinalis]